MSDNQIKDMNPFVSPGLSSLRELELSGNQLADVLPEQALRFMQSLKILSLEENLFEEVI